MKNCVLIIDAQNDFCDPDGSLYVSGAKEDMQRLEKFLNINILDIELAIFTRDVHPEFNVSMSKWFKRPDNENNPPAFTSLTIDDFDCLKGEYLNRELGDYVVANPEVVDRIHQYIKWLNKQNCKHFIWPEHCINGSKGFQLIDNLRSIPFKQVEYVDKGTNPLTHPFSAVTDAEPSATNCQQVTNTKLIKTLMEFDNVFIAGEARNFCVGETVIDLLINSDYPYDMSKRIILIEDCMSDVPNFDFESRRFSNTIKTFNLRTCDSDFIMAEGKNGR